VRDIKELVEALRRCNHPANCKECPDFLIDDCAEKLMEEAIDALVTLKTFNDMHQCAAGKPHIIFGDEAKPNKVLRCFKGDGDVKGLKICEGVVLEKWSDIPDEKNMGEELTRFIFVGANGKKSLLVLINVLIKLYVFWEEDCDG